MSKDGNAQDDVSVFFAGDLKEIERLCDQSTPIRVSLSGHDQGTLSEIDAALPDIPDEPLDPKLALRKLVAERKAQEDADYERRGVSIRARSAAEARQRYADEKEAEGKGPVRGYVWREHEPQRPNESHAQYKTRINTENQRTYRGKTEATVRKNAKPSQMTDEEQLMHNRALANARQAKSRDKKRNENGLEEALAAAQIASKSIM